MAYKNTLITGITDFLVLAILKSKGDCYAYEISKYITSESNELLSISQIRYIRSCTNWKMSK